jgi:hypothetical protein
MSLAKLVSTTSISLEDVASLSGYDFVDNVMHSIRECGIEDKLKENLQFEGTNLPDIKQYQPSFFRVVGLYHLLDGDKSLQVYARTQIYNWIGKEIAELETLEAKYDEQSQNATVKKGLSQIREKLARFKALKSSIRTKNKKRFRSIIGSEDFETELAKIAVENIDAEENRAIANRFQLMRLHLPVVKDYSFLVEQYCGLLDWASGLNTRFATVVKEQIITRLTEEKETNQSSWETYKTHRSPFKISRDAEHEIVKFAQKQTRINSGLLDKAQDKIKAHSIGSIVVEDLNKDTVYYFQDDDRRYVHARDAINILQSLGIKVSDYTLRERIMKNDKLRTQFFETGICRHVLSRDKEQYILDVDYLPWVLNAEVLAKFERKGLTIANALTNFNFIAERRDYGFDSQPKSDPQELLLERGTLKEIADTNTTLPMYRIVSILQARTTRSIGYVHGVIQKFIGEKKVEVQEPVPGLGVQCISSTYLPIMFRAL